MIEVDYITVGLAIYLIGFLAFHSLQPHFYEILYSLHNMLVTLVHSIEESDPVVGVFDINSDEFQAIKFVVLDRTKIFFVAMIGTKVERGNPKGKLTWLYFYHVIRYWPIQYHNYFVLKNLVERYILKKANTSFLEKRFSIIQVPDKYMYLKALLFEKTNIADDWKDCFVKED